MRFKAVVHSACQEAAMENLLMSVYLVDIEAQRRGKWRAMFVVRKGRPFKKGGYSSLRGKNFGCVWVYRAQTAIFVI